MQNWRSILAAFMVLFVLGVSGNVVLADDGEDLLEAVCRGTNEQVSLWFEKNADLISAGQGDTDLFAARDKEGWTAVTCAAANNDHQSAELLIKAGAEINVKDNFGWTPLMYAADVKIGVTMVSYLLANGADPNIRNNDGDTALKMAVSGNNVETIKLLIDKGANVEITDKEGNTPLMLAAANGRLEAVSQLLAGGADLGKTDKKGLTALQLAQANGHIEIVDLLNPKEEKEESR